MRKREEGRAGKREKERESSSERGSTGRRRVTGGGPHTHTTTRIRCSARVHARVRKVYARAQSSSERDRGGPSSYCNTEVSISLHYRTVRDSSRGTVLASASVRALRHGARSLYANLRDATRRTAAACIPLFPVARRHSTRINFAHAITCDTRLVRARRGTQDDVPISTRPLLRGREAGEIPSVYSKY